MDKAHAIKAQPVPLHTMKPVQHDRLKTATQQDAAKAAEQFETLLAQQLVHSMQSSLDGGSLLGPGVAGDVYSGLTEWELAKVVASRTPMGLKNTILQQLSAKEKRP